jgi:hypothetical protein
MVRYLETVPENQRRGEITRFETNDVYTYTCGDASRAYGEKAREFTRQFVFLQPGTFVVFDRVTSTKADARKVWQLHADTEPVIAGTTSTITGEQGKLTCITLLPASPVIKKEYQHLEGAQNTSADLWDITVEPPRTTRSEQFLHVLYAGDKDDPQLPTAELVKGDGSVGARIRLGGTFSTVTFATDGPSGGHVRVERGDAVVVDRPLTDGIQAQSGYGIEER